MENVFKNKLPFYELLSHLVIGLFLMPLIIFLFKMSGLPNQFEIPNRTVYFWITAYAAGLVLHKVVEFIRDIKSPSTTKGGDFCKLKVILIRNYRYVISASEYAPNHKNNDYYKAYEEAIKKEQNAAIIHQLEYQETFIRNLIGVEVLYLTCFLLLIVCHGKCFFLCASAMSLTLMIHPLLYGVILVLMICCISLPQIYQNLMLCANSGIPLDYFLIAFIIALVALCFTGMAHYFAQLKVYRMVWELGSTSYENDIENSKK